jgi:hypothetical protein
MGPVMPGAPFSMSPDAALWVGEQLRWAESHEPRIAGMVPGLSYALSSTTGDGKGGVLEHIPYPHFGIGWFGSEKAGAGDGMWIEVLDRKVFLHHTTLEELRGKHLTLQKVKSTLGSRVLLARAEEKGIFKFLDD